MLLVRQLRQIRRRSVPTDTFKTLVASLVLTRLYYGNSVLAARSSGLPGLSTPVCVECGCATDVPSASIGPHHRRACLPPLAAPAERVQHKIALLVYKVLHGLAPQYLGLLNYVADLSGRRSLRSATTNHLTVPPVKLTTVANQPAFPGCRPTDLERPDGRRDICRVVVYLSPTTQS